VPWKCAAAWLTPPAAPICQAEKALLSLSESGHVVLKEAGKAKVFWANQARS
jgi:hypothetical protein